jgi:hypothetical protein
VESRFKPPKPFFKYLKTEYVYSRYGNGNIPLSDESQSNLLCAAYGVTAWIKTNKGASWCFQLFGIEELEPHYGFVYYYIPPHGEKRKLSEDHGLRIFRQTKAKPVEILKSSIDIAKKVVYTEGWRVPPEDMIKAAISAYRTWIQTELGFEWVKSVFRPIMEVNVHDGISYRCTSVNGEVYWLGCNHVKAEQKPTSMCINCDLTYPCTTDLKGIGNLCNRCYGENFGEMDVLMLCNRHECAEICCENYMSNGKLEDMLFEKYGAIR